MSLANETRAPLRNADRFFIGGDWVKPSSDAMIDVIDPGTEELFFSIAEAGQADMSRAVAAARQAFDEGPWPRMSHTQRAEYLRAIAAGLRERTEDIGQIWPRESGVLHKIARRTGVRGGYVRVLRGAGQHVRPARRLRSCAAGGMVNMRAYQVVPIGWVESPLTDRGQAPRQGNEGAPDAWIVFEPEYAEGIRDLEAGTEIIVLTWLDRAARDVLATRPRDDPARPPLGVFSTRSPDRPNPIGLHRVQIVATEGLRMQVRLLEALDKTPVLDVKPVLDKATER
jgi:tRNA-Thr(GGU) m(6)t(6)A37 methyltransferase TsaA